MADETGYSYDQIYVIAHRGRPVGKRLVKIVNGLPQEAEEEEVSRLTGTFRPANTLKVTRQIRIAPL